MTRRPVRIVRLWFLLTAGIVLAVIWPIGIYWSVGFGFIMFGLLMPVIEELGPCIRCDANTNPEGMQLDLSGVVDTLGFCPVGCPSLNTTYILTKTSGCVFSHNFSMICTTYDNFTLTLALVDRVQIRGSGNNAIWDDMIAAPHDCSIGGTATNSSGHGQCNLTASSFVYTPIGPFT